MRSLRRCRRGAEALTLIEILASLALLGSLLAATLLARGQMARQWLKAHEKHEAVQVADELLEAWWSAGPATVPRHDHGYVEDSTLAWRTEPVEAEALADLEAELIRLEVFDTRGDSRTLARVEFIVPRTSPPPTE